MTQMSPVRSVPTPRLEKQFSLDPGCKPTPTAQQVAQGTFVYLFLEMPQLHQWCFERPVMLRESCPQFIGIPQGNIIKFFFTISSYNP